MLNKLNSLLKSKKKKKTRSAILHELILAIHDRRLVPSCTLINELSSNCIRRKKPQESNRAFLLAMANRLDTVCLIFLDKGFPENINAPIHGQQTEQTAPERADLPNYFMLAIAFDCEPVFKSMIKVLVLI